MTDVSREELISAYLDDELSSEERARVETWLAESPELRQLHDELMALRAGMQSLPSHKLQSDLGSLVLRRVEQETKRSAEESGPARTISEKNGSEKNGSEKNGSEKNGSEKNGSEKNGSDKPDGKIARKSGGAVLPGVPWWERGTDLRRVIWPALAVAAALAVLIYDARQRPEEQQVAKAPDPNYEISAPPAMPAELSAPAADRLDAQAPAGGASAPGAVQGGHLAEQALPAPASDNKLEVMPRSAQRATVPTAEDRAFGAPMEAKEAPAQAPARVPSASPGLMNAEVKLYAEGDEPVQTVVVTQRYFQDKRFEKLLEDQKIDWQRVPPPAAEAMIKSAEKQVEQAAGSKLLLQKLQDQSLRAGYMLNASDDVVNNVLSQVPPPAGTASNGLAFRQNAAQQKAKAQQQQGIRVLLVAPPDPSAAPGGTKN